MSDATAKEVEIVLQREYITNGRKLAGKVKVPQEIADDLLRREAEANLYEKNLMRKREEHVKVDEISVGGV